MSQIISTPQQINQHPVNNSSSKQLFSFSKADRFSMPKKIMNHKISYDLPSMKSSRAAGIGYGGRDIFKTGVDSPSPTNYNHKSDFNATTVSKAFSFGIAREAYSKVYIKEHPIRDPSVPGPGQYQIPGIVGNEASKYTMRPKTVSMSDLNYKGQPGPGSYEPKPALNDKGYYYVSKFKNSMATSIDPPTKKSVPGPGQYEFNQGMNQQGSYFVSKFMSSMCRTHYHADRSTLLGQKLQTPGPGNYRLPSDFGYYESKKKYDSQRSATGSPARRMASSASQPVLNNNKKEEL
ncbi:UNKNOWN [Stylonychia lemnae]|uniref:Uncharacterized protein n=1 Tax=Stylonychia lemnae TaxID=5949 RepID=A0A078AIR8_STYLE|nr:UNKNOWN [Stylonychia lemnae]|eukprot:CDW81826.1 UNKNOWN [Stylonychia lemnae]